jgi:hypothetical protein
MRTSIDKIKVSTTDFCLNQIDTFGVNSHNKQPNQPISESACCYDEKGNPIIAQNIFIHSIETPYHLDIKPLNGIPTTWLTFNPNKFDSLDVAINRISNDLKDNHKFEFGFNENKLSRVDIARDCQMQFNMIDYIQPIDMLMKTRYQKDSVKYPNSMLYKTTGWQKCTYDKGLKNQLDEGIKDYIATNTKLMRDEIRLLNPKYINKHLGFNNLHTLIDLNDSQPALSKLYADIQNKFIRDIQKNNSTNQIGVGDMVNLLDNLINEGYKTKYIALQFINITSEGNSLLQRKQWIDAVTQWVNSRQWNTRSNKSQTYKRYLDAFDNVLRENNKYKNMMTKKSRESINSKLNEYSTKFLVA